jgi:signal transduction histidine kinase
MNRRILIQVTTPAVAIGLLLLGACLASAWYITKLQTDLTRVLSQNVRSLQAAQELELRVRQLRFHSFRYLIDPQHYGLKPIQDDHAQFEDALEEAKKAAYSPDERAWVQKIEIGYKTYHSEMDRLREELVPGRPYPELLKMLDSHPIQHVVNPCQELIQVNKEAIEETAAESDRVGDQVRKVMLLLGLGGPIGGLIIGFGVARALSRSIYQLSVRVQDIANRLDQDVGSVSVAAGGDIRSLDQQLQYVVRRVEEVAQRLQRHQWDMLRAEQLSAVGQLAASVAHEVRNPLTSVKMLVDAVLRTQNRKPLTLEDLQVIHGELARVEQTVQGLLDFARPPAPQRSACDLRQLITQAADLIRARARQQKVMLETDLPEEPVEVDIDRGQFRTVLVNLFLNALDAMPRGGELRIELQPATTEQVRLTISDTGPGIAKEMAGRLFLPFASTKATGTGLGLSICRRIIEEHGGRISGGNRPEGGATFAITLPALVREEVHAHASGR